MNVGMVGLGLMGSAMARSLLAAGHTVFVYNRTEAKAQALVAQGGRPLSTPAEVACRSDVVITMVTDPDAVAQVIFGPDGILTSLSPESVHCDMSTVAPASAARMAAEYQRQGNRFVQAPVLGSVRQIEAGTLLVFGGGSEADVKVCEPVWKSFAERVWHFATAEEAATVKLSCNMLIGHMILGLGQSLLFAQKGGVPPATLLEILQSSAMGCAMYSSKGQKLLARDFNANFFVRHMLKDLSLVSEAASDTHMPLPLHAVTRELFVAADQRGWGEEDYSAVVKVLEQLAGVVLSGHGMPCPDKTDYAASAFAG